MPQNTFSTTKSAVQCNPHSPGSRAPTGPATPVPNRQRLTAGGGLHAAAPNQRNTHQLQDTNTLHGTTALANTSRDDTTQIK